MGTGGDRGRVVMVRLTAAHAAPVLRFEQENRDWFGEFVPDRGDAYFAEFEDRHRALLDEQDGGTCHFHVLTDDDGTVVGRVNLLDVTDTGSAELGYRLARRATGHGLATAAVRLVCHRARTAYGLTALTALVADGNPASAAVLHRTGFRPDGPADVGGTPGTRYVRPLGPADADTELHLPRIEH
ncbi:GNAT family N-acetyltransferase [Streptomyces bambusae]|uniref:GNAT family N-acetyltransferase n=1 Tax=Streptomyces bambusae TaxID=1550616 RepID=UPI001CFD4CE2|nr:GNAT family N-acetyltransferase [Streptomyces bambusae]MCB5164327.1 GNAT family N-acetyltransferase [Streptomyces bambusae]